MIVDGGGWLWLQAHWGWGAVGWQSVGVADCKLSGGALKPRWCCPPASLGGSWGGHSVNPLAWHLEQAVLLRSTSHLTLSKWQCEQALDPFFLMPEWSFESRHCGSQSRKKTRYDLERTWGSRISCRYWFGVYTFVGTWRPWASRWSSSRSEKGQCTEILAVLSEVYLYNDRLWYHTGIMDWEWFFKPMEWIVQQDRHRVHRYLPYVPTMCKPTKWILRSDNIKHLEQRDKNLLVQQLLHCHMSIVAIPTKVIFHCRKCKFDRVEVRRVRWKKLASHSPV